MKLFNVVLAMFLVMFLCGSAFGTPLFGSYSYDNDNDSSTSDILFDVVDRSQDDDSLDISGDFYTYEGSYDYKFSGRYLGTVTGLSNDSNNPEVIDYLIGTYLDDPSYTVDYEVKADIGSSTSTSSDGNLTVTTTQGTEGHAGEWSLSYDPPLAAEFYIVKGAKEFALYYLKPAQTEGYWTTNHLLTPNDSDQTPKISHLSAITTAAPVPEPTTMLLSGLGLLFMGGYLRKRKNAKEAN